MAQDIKALVREWFEMVWDRRDTATIDRMVWPDAINHGLGESPEPARGTGQFKQFHKAFLSAFPDMVVTLEDVIVEGDKSAVRVSFAGTHTGEGIGIPPTNRRFRSTAIVILYWRDGKLIEGWNEFDAAGMMRQLQAPDAQLRQV